MEWASASDLVEAILESDAIAKPPAMKAKLEGVSLGQDKDGFYVFTHRARSRSYPRAESIPEKVIQEIETTG